MALGVLMVFITGGSTNKLNSVDFHSYTKYIFIGVLIILGFELLITFLPDQISSPFLVYKKYITIVVYFLLISILGLNRHLKFLSIVQAGFILNLLPMLFNGLRMPVSRAALESTGQNFTIAVLENDLMYNHVLADSNTRFYIFSDIIPINIGFIKNVISIGDILIGVGIFMFIIYYSKDRSKV